MLNIPALLAVLFGSAVIGAWIARMVRLPLLVGYLVAGVSLAVVGRVGGPDTAEFMETFGQIGVTLLLFLIGLEFPISQLKQIGKTIILSGTVQILISSALGWVWLRVLGLEAQPAIYLAPALAFGSTIVVVKVLSEKRDLASLSGRLCLGFLLMQDFVALGMLTVLSAEGSPAAATTIVTLALKAAVLLGGTIIVSASIGPWILRKLAGAGELLYVGALAWCLVASAVVSSDLIGFTPEIGGFLAGLAMAGANEHLQIAARLRPLRDFFLVVFFVGLGAQMRPETIGSQLPRAVGLAAFAMIINPVLVMGLLALKGYKRRTWFLAGMHMGQLSEFSLILAAVVVRRGLAGPEILPMFVLGCILTMAWSGYVMFKSEWLYRKAAHVLRRLDFGKVKGGQLPALNQHRSGHVVLFGYDRTGSRLLPVLEKMDLGVVVVDFNPNQIQSLIVKKEDAVYGDMGDVELYDEVGVAKAKLVVSTVVDRDDNLQLLEFVRVNCPVRPVILLTASNAADAEVFYDHGANFVLVPHLVGGDFLASMLKERGVEANNWAVAK